MISGSSPPTVTSSDHQTLARTEICSTNVLTLASSIRDVYGESFRGGLPRKLTEFFKMGRDGVNARRVTTTLTSERKAQLERLADREGLTEAWVVRRALEKYMDEIGDSPIIGAATEAGNARG